jgi:glycine dehydrogenase subunit 2
MTEIEAPDYHAVRWNEPIILQLGRKGRRGFSLPASDGEIKAAVGNIESRIPERMRRKSPPKLPELSEPEVVRHYIRLSQQTYGVDSGIHIHGTCTMKYSPKVDEAVARSPKIADIHPLQDSETVQGVLAVMYQLQKWLGELSGMAEFSLQPRGGAHAVLGNARIIQEYHRQNGELEQRNEIITTVLSHPCNGGAPATLGFKVVTLYPDEETGYPNTEALKAAVTKHTAGLMMTDPYDTGVFDSNIEEYIKLIHEAGGLVAIDQANANSILGRLRIGDIGADLCHFNLHKSFSTPHASTGPGSAAIGAKQELAKFLPVPIVNYDGEKYYLDYERPHTIGKVGEFYGVVPNMVRAYAWIMSMGAEGLLEASEVAVINNNYLIKKLLEVRGVSLPWYKVHPMRLQEGRFSLEKMREETGIGIDDVNRRIIDYGLQDLETSHEPWIIPEPFTPEPPESTSKEDLDQLAQVLHAISREAYNSPDIVKTAPHNAAISRIDRTPSSDPKKWAMTWRAYLKKAGSDSDGKAAR